MRQTCDIIKAIDNDEHVDIMEALSLVRDMIYEIHGTKLSIKEVAKRYRDIKEGLEPKDFS